MNLKRSINKLVLLDGLSQMTTLQVDASVINDEGLLSCRTFCATWRTIKMGHCFLMPNLLEAVNLDFGSFQSQAHQILICLRQHVRYALHLSFPFP